MPKEYLITGRLTELVNKIHSAIITKALKTAYWQSNPTAVVAQGLKTRGPLGALQPDLGRIQYLNFPNKLLANNCFLSSNYPFLTYEILKLRIIKFDGIIFIGQTNHASKAFIL